MRFWCFILYGVVYGLTAGATVASASSLVVDHYPQCQYDVIDTISASQKIDIDGGLSESLMKQYAPLVFQDLEQQAIAAGAKYVVLIERTIENNKAETWTKNRKASTVLSFTAELIADCQLNDSLPRVAAPYGKNGLTQKQLSIGSIGGFETQITFNLPNNKKRELPTIASNNVSLAQGVYGVQLGTSSAEVRAFFGTPTFEMPLDNGQVLLAYGRSLWLVFQHDILAYASSFAPLLSTEFLNMLAFDDRFDDQTWKVFEKFGKQSPVTEVLSDTHGFIRSDKLLVSTLQNRQLVLTTETYQTAHNVRTEVVLGFVLKYASFSQAALTNNDVSAQALARVTEYVNNPQRDILSVDMLPVQPLAKAWVDAATSLYVYGPKLVIEQKGSSINKLSFLDTNMFTGEDSPEWSFGGVQQGQTFEHVMMLAGDSAFGMDDLIEISADAYTQNLYFYETQSELKLLSSQVSLY